MNNVDITTTKMTFKILYFAAVFCALGYIRNASGQIAVFDIELRNLLKMQVGIGWPHVLHVVEGNDILLRLDSTLENQQSCTVTTAGGETIDLDHPTTSRFERWDEFDCGVRVHNVTVGDEGRWRLTAARSDESIEGWTEVFVVPDTPAYSGPPISLQDGQSADVDLTTLSNSYCLVAQPFSESQLIPGHCHVSLDRASRAVQGNWNVVLGIPGRVQELHVDRQVEVESERLDVGYVRDANTNRLHLYCNILHTEKNITFCRFQKTSSTTGYNVLDGLSDGSHSYYGDGFLKRECGMTIERPSEQDYGTWRCSVGVQQWIGNHIHQQTPMQALISIAQGRMGRTNDLQGLSDNEELPAVVFVQENQSFTLMCRGVTALSYCWFQHPNGSQYTPIPIADEDQLFWYTGENLRTGDCGITFSHVTVEDAGDWTCHMGSSTNLGVELTDTITVRVTGPLAANQKEVMAAYGETLTIYCHSSNGNRPLDYCRFVTPTYLGLNIDSSITEENAILDRFYFTPGRNLDFGDCSLTIKYVTEEDIGEWTCAALINEDTMEARDVVMVDIPDSLLPRSQAGIVGMAVGLSVLFVALAGVLFYKKGLPMLKRTRPTPSVEPMVNFDNLSSVGSISSTEARSDVSRETGTQNDYANWDRDFTNDRQRP